MISMNSVVHHLRGARDRGCLRHRSPRTCRSECIRGQSPRRHRAARNPPSRVSPSDSAWEQNKIGDIDRHAHIHVSVTSISSDPSTLLFGHGFRQHGWIISQHLRSFYYAHHRPDIARRVKDDSSTEGFTALIVDTGIVGLFLLGANLFLLAWRIFRQKIGWDGVILVSAIGVLFLWLFVINLLDVGVYYIAIMPSGLLCLLAQPNIRPGTKTPHHQKNPQSR